MWSNRGRGRGIDRVMKGEQNEPRSMGRGKASANQGYGNTNSNSGYGGDSWHNGPSNNDVGGGNAGGGWGTNNNDGWSSGGASNSANDGWSTGGASNTANDGWSTGGASNTANDEWSTGGASNTANDGWSTGGASITANDGWSTGGASNTANDDWESGGGDGGGGWNTQSDLDNNNDFGSGGYRGGGGGRGRGRGGGGSRGGGRGGACFKCGEEGHMSRECPDGDSGGRKGGSGCYKCGEDGHISRDCPSGGGGGGGGGSRACFKCGEEGHMSRDCPNNDGGGGGRSGGKGCFKCGEDGHISRDCPNNDGDGGGRGGGKGCFKCGEDGHISRDCPNNDGDGGGRGRGGGGSGCRRCGEEGHKSIECTKIITGEDGKEKENYVPVDPAENIDALFEGMNVGINFSKYDHIPVKISGNDPPSKITSFQSSGLRDLLLENVARAKYAKPTPVQKCAIPMIMNGRDIMACAQTGSGKTAAFLLPILHRLLEQNCDPHSMERPAKPQAVVMSPTRELAIQIYEECCKFSHGSCMKSVLTYGGTNVGSQARKLQSGCNIVIATPGRLLDFMDKGNVSFEEVQFLVLDEADRMLDMGFREAIDRVVNHDTMVPKEDRQTLMFSATFPPSIQEMATNYLNDYLFLTVGIVGGACSDVEQYFHLIEKPNKRDKLHEILRDSDPNWRTIIFAETQRTTDFLACDLSDAGMKATSIHGARFQSQREQALRDLKQGRMNILVATAVAARGLDIKGVDHVINYDMPKTIDEYVHRIGRTGRLGNTGAATSMFVNPDDCDLVRPLVKILQESQQTVPEWLENMVGQGGAGGDDGWGGSGGYGGRDVRQHRGRGGDTYQPPAEQQFDEEW